jgi:hypothetical protein
MIQKENLGNDYYCGYFELMGMLAIDQVRAEKGAVLLGAGEGLRASVFIIDFIPFMVREREGSIAKARKQLDEEAFQKAWQARRNMSTEEAIKYALEGLND